MRWLSTRCNPLCWLPAFLLFFFSSSSFSSSCTPGYPLSLPSVGFYRIAGISGYDYPSPSIGCSAAASVDKFWGEGYTGSGSGTGSDACTVTKTSDGTTNKTSISFIAGSCPSGYSVSGTTCVQNCTPTCPAAGTAGSGSMSVFDISGAIPASGNVCTEDNDKVCVATCTGGCMSGYNDVTGKSWWIAESFSYTGQTCSSSGSTATAYTPVTVTPVNTPPKTSADCPGGSGFAQINNVGMCLPSGTTFSGGTSTASITGGGSSTVTSTTTINRDGTSTTTTTTTNKDSGGTVTGTTTDTSTGSLNQNNGGNDKPLNLGPAPAFDSTLPNDPTFNIKTITNPTLSTSLFGVSASCPEPLTFEAMGRSFEITFQPICDLADIIRGIILMLSAIVAIRAVVTK